MTGPEQLAARGAIEALRAGVPNRIAIRLLGSLEAGIEAQFTRGLMACATAAPEPGLLIAGGYGTGKSPLLGHLQEEALRRGFVVSRVTISKETPLSQPGAVYAAAMRGAIVQGRPEDAVAVALAEIQGRAGAVQALEEWAGREGLLPVFAAVSYLLGRELPPDLLRGIEAFLAGGKPPTQAVRNRLAQLGARSMFGLTGMKAAQLQLERQRFVARLFRAAGFAGWCVLLDEVELIGRYGAVQRATAYAELARWLGIAPALPQPDIHVTAAIADDFAAAVMDIRQDEERLPERLRLKGLPRQADQAAAAMLAIRDAPALRAPEAADLLRHGEVLRGAYGAAYGWDAPPASVAVRETRRTMRHHIRGWIIEWDMQRLYGGRTAVTVRPDGYSYVENDELAVGEKDEAAAVEDDDQAG